MLIGLLRGSEIGRNWSSSIGVASGRAEGTETSHGSRTHRSCCSIHLGATMVGMFVPDQFQREGWPGQLRRVERWQCRVLKALETSTSGLADLEVVDLLFAFFQSAYHLRDWIQKSGGATQAQLDDLMAQTPSLKLCRELCNGSKHLVLNDTHKSARIHMMQESRGEGQCRIRMIAFEARGGGTDYAYVDELVNDIVAAWQGFCRALPNPQLPLSTRIP